MARSKVRQTACGSFAGYLEDQGLGKSAGSWRATQRKLHDAGRAAAIAAALHESLSPLLKKLGLTDAQIGRKAVLAPGTRRQRTLQGGRKLIQCPLLFHQCPRPQEAIPCMEEAAQAHHRAEAGIPRTAAQARTHASTVSLAKPQAPSMGTNAYVFRYIPAYRPQQKTLLCTWFLVQNIPGTNPKCRGTIDAAGARSRPPQRQI